MSMTTEEMRLLGNMLDACQDKFGDFSRYNIVCASGCEGHGASIWSTCDVLFMYQGYGCRKREGK